MKKPVIITIILFVLAALSCTLFFVIKSKQDQKAESQTEKLNEYILFNFDSGSITNVDISCKDGEFKIGTVDGLWKRTDVDNYTINADYFTNICTYMCSLTAVEDYGTVDSSKLASYGLDEPTTITCSNETDSYTVYVGKMTPSGENYYIMVEGRDTIYAIDSLYGSVLDANENLIKSNKLVDYTDSDVSQIVISRNNDEAINITLNEDSLWELTDSKYSNFGVDNTKISTMLSVITRLEVEQFITNDLQDYSEYGFDKPYAEMYVYGKDGTSSHLLFSYFGENSDTYTHVLDTETGEVALYYTYDVDFIEKNIEDVLISTIHSEDIFNTAKLDINYHGEEISFNIDAENTQFDVNGTDIDALGADACDYFYNFYESLSGLSFSKVDVDAVPSGDTEITVKFTYLDGTTRQLDFVQIDETTYWLLIDGEYSGCIVREKYISGTSAFMYWYDKLAAYITETTT